MTDWPWCLLEIALYTAFAYMAIGMGLDARKRWRQYRAQQEASEPDNDESELDEPEASAVHLRTHEPAGPERGRR